MEKYINLLTDYGFKKVLGEEPNKDLLISFLNSLLPARHQIADLEYSRSEWQGVAIPKRLEVMDFLCKPRHGGAFLVELQLAKYNWFTHKSRYRASFPLQQQALQSDTWDCRFSALYSIGVLDFAFADADKYAVLHTGPLRGQQDANVGEELICIDICLPHFKKSLAELSSVLDCWLYLFRHLPSMQEMPSAWHRTVFDRLFKVSEVGKLSPQEGLAYENNMRIYRDLKNVVDTAFAEGRKIGLAKAQTIALTADAGRQQTSIEIARKASAMGLPDAQIAALSGLEVEQIALLRQA